jgi:uncharacterized protein (UPF0218 family)
MTIVYTLTPELRMKLKKPLGTLIRGSFAETMEEFKGFLEKEKPTSVISVGDTVSRNLIRSNIIPDLAILDNKTMRRSIKPVSIITEKSIKVVNPPATITSEAISAIQNSLKANKCIKIIVVGEEDLLTLVAIMLAPENAIVVYGQPYEGMVVVKVTPTKKAEIAAILKDMESVRKAK